MTDAPINPWPDEHLSRDETMSPVLSAESPRGGADYARLIAATRLLQDRLAGAAVTGEPATELAVALETICERLQQFQVPEHERFDGWRPDLPGRGHGLLPPYVIDAEDETSLRGRVRFTRFYLGGNRAAHGGSQPLLFDDVFGRVANHHHEGVARTAYLKTNYRQITPIDVELRFEAALDRVDGRKRWVTGRLLDDAGAVLCDAEGLFLQLLPGQP